MSIATRPEDPQASRDKKWKEEEGQKIEGQKMKGRTRYTTGDPPGPVERSEVTVFALL